MRRQQWGGYWMLLPAVLAFGAWVVYPILDTVRLSFESWSAVHQVRVAVGLGNYGELLRDPRFGLALRNNGLFIALSLAVQLPVALALALGIGSTLRRHQMLRTLVFAPFVLPVVAVGLVWRLIYEPNLGALNALLESWGRGHWAQGWLGESDLAIYAVVAVSCWRYVGFHMMILLAGLQAIPDDLYEAARLDGASNWQTFVHVTLPGLRRVLLVDALLITVGSVKIFDLVKVLTDGGPGYASEVLATLMYRLAFVEDRMGYSAAIAVVMLIVTLLFTVVYLRLTKLEEEALSGRVISGVGALALAGAGVGAGWAVGCVSGNSAQGLGAAVLVWGLPAGVRLVVEAWERLPRRWGSGLRDALFGVGTALLVLPVVWAAISSFKSLNDLMLHPWGLPEQWLVSNYVQAARGSIVRYLVNSAVLTTLAVVLALGVSAPVAYVVTRLRLPGATAVYGLILTGILVPVHAAMIPLYKTSQALGLHDWWALLGPYVAFGLPLTVLLLRAYFAGLPSELSEAAQMDGCSHWQLLWRIYVPVARPAVATAAIFQASTVYNELPLALVLIQNRVWQTLPVGLLSFQGEHATDWAVVMAGVTLSVVPLLVVYFLFQQHIVKGLTAGAVK
jgi:multiple sugar transport system permease protein